MGSPLGSVSANIFLSHREENWLNECPLVCKPTFYRSYVDIFVLSYTVSGDSAQLSDYPVSTCAVILKRL